ILVLLLAPAGFQLVVGLLRSLWKRNLAQTRATLAAFSSASTAALLRLTFLAHQTLLSLDAIMRVIVRRLVTRRRLLEWETAAEAELSRGRPSLADIYLAWIPALPIVIGLLLWWERPSALLAAAPILLLWICTKPITLWLNQPSANVEYELSTDDRV